MPPKDKTYRLNGEIYDIPTAEVDNFLQENPGAEEVQSYVMDKDTFDIPLADVADFTRENPTASLLYPDEQQKKSTGTAGGSVGSAGGGDSVSTANGAKPLTPTQQQTVATYKERNLQTQPWENNLRLYPDLNKQYQESKLAFLPAADENGAIQPAMAIDSKGLLQVANEPGNAFLADLGKSQDSFINDFASKLRGKYDREAGKYLDAEGQEVPFASLKEGDILGVNKGMRTGAGQTLHTDFIKLTKQPDGSLHWQPWDASRIPNPNFNQQDKELLADVIVSKPSFLPTDKPKRLSEMTQDESNRYNLSLWKKEQEPLLQELYQLNTELDTSDGKDPEGNDIKNASLIPRFLQQHPEIKPVLLETLASNTGKLVADRKGLIDESIAKAYGLSTSITNAAKEHSTDERELLQHLTELQDQYSGEVRNQAIQRMLNLKQRMGTLNATMAKNTDASRAETYSKQMEGLQKEFNQIVADNRPAIQRYEQARSYFDKPELQWFADAMEKQRKGRLLLSQTRFLFPKQDERDAANLKQEENPNGTLGFLFKRFGGAVGDILTKTSAIADQAINALFRSDSDSRNMRAFFNDRIGRTEEYFNPGEGQRSDVTKWFGGAASMIPYFITGGEGAVAKVVSNAAFLAPEYYNAQREANGQGLDGWKANAYAAMQTLPTALVLNVFHTPTGQATAKGATLSSETFEKLLTPSLRREGMAELGGIIRSNIATDYGKSVLRNVVEASKFSAAHVTNVLTNSIVNTLADTDFNTDLSHELGSLTETAGAMSIIGLGASFRRGIEHNQWNKGVQDYYLKMAAEGSPETALKVIDVLRNNPLEDLSTADVKRLDDLEHAITTISGNNFPEGFTTSQKVKALPLMNEIDRLNNELKNVHESFKPAIKEKIKDLNNQVAELAADPAKAEQELNETLQPVEENIDKISRVFVQMPEGARQEPPTVTIAAKVRTPESRVETPVQTEPAIRADEPAPVDGIPTDATQPITEQPLTATSETEPTTLKAKAAAALGSLPKAADAPRTATRQAVDKVATAIDNTFGATEGYQGTEIKAGADFDQAVTEASSLMQRNDGTVYGFIKDGRIVLNGDRLNTNTPLHESGHFLMQWAKQNNTDLHRAGMDLTKGSTELEEVKANPTYQQQAEQLLSKGATPEQVEDFYRDEALAKVVGNMGERLTGEQRNVFQKWWQQFVDGLRSRFGKSFENLSADEVANMSLEDFAQRAAKRVLSGKALGGTVEAGTQFHAAADTTDIERRIRSFAEENKGASEADLIEAIQEATGYEPNIITGIVRDAVAGKPFQYNFERAISIANESVEKNYEAAGYTPPTEREKLTLARAYDEAGRIAEVQPDATRKLVKNLIDSPRPASDVEIAQLLREDIRLQNTMSKQNEAVNNAIIDTDSQTYRDLQASRSQTQYEYERLHQAIAHAKSENSAALRSFGMLALNNYSLAGMRKRFQAANGGKAIDAKQEAMIADYQKQIAEAQVKADAEMKEQRRAYEQKINALQVKLAKRENREEDQSEKRSGRKGYDSKTSYRNGLTVFSGRKQQPVATDATPVSFSVGDAEPAVADSRNPFTKAEQKGLYDMFRAKVHEGGTDIEAISRDILSDIKEYLPDTTERQVRDSITGYGKEISLTKEGTVKRLKELKAAGKLISAIEDAEKGLLPIRDEKKRQEQSQKVKELRKELSDVMEANGLSFPTPKQAPLTDEQIQDRRLNATEQANTELQRKLAENDLATKKARQVGNTAEIDRLQQENKGLRKQLEQRRKEAGIGQYSEAEIAKRRLQQMRNNLQQQITKYEQRIQNNDFTTTTPVEPVETTGQDLRDQTKLFYLKREFDRKVQEEELKHRPVLERALDWVRNYQHFNILSSPGVLGKLGAAVMYRQLSNVIENNVVMTGLKAIPGVKGIASKAPYEGTQNLKADIKAITGMFSLRQLKDSLQVVTKGESRIDAMLSKKPASPASFFGLTGRIHGAIKDPVKNAVFRLSMEKRLQQAAASGKDISDPALQLGIANMALGDVETPELKNIMYSAYNDAKRAIFMNDNPVVNAYKSALHTLEQAGTGGKALSLVAHLLLPIVKIPTNFFAETMHYTPGVGMLEIAYSLRKGIEPLTEDQADFVMRVMKKQTLGLGLTALGYFNPHYFGGLGFGGRKDENGLTPGQINAGGLFTIPEKLLHSPIFIPMQVGAMVRKIHDQREMEGYEDGYVKAMEEVAAELIREQPFIKETYNTNDKGILARGIGLVGTMIPASGFVNWLGQITDTRDGETIQRKAEWNDLPDQLMKAIPGLRQQLPERQPTTAFEDVVMQAGQKKYEEPKEQSAATEAKKAAIKEASAEYQANPEEGLSEETTEKLARYGLEPEDIEKVAKKQLDEEGEPLKAAEKIFKRMTTDEKLRVWGAATDADKQQFLSLLPKEEALEKYREDYLSIDTTLQDPMDNNPQELTPPETNTLQYFQSKFRSKRRAILEDMLYWSGMKENIGTPTPKE